MANFGFEIITPKNTTKISPKKTEIILTTGIITKVRIYLFPNNGGLLGLQLLHGLKTFAPIDGNVWYRGDSLQIEWNDYFELKGNDTKLIAHTYNLDDTYEHGLQLAIDVLPKEIVLPTSETPGMLQRLLDYFGR